VTQGITLRLSDVQRWDLEAVLRGLCPCNGGTLPSGVTTAALHALLDELEEATQTSEARRPKEPTEKQKRQVLVRAAKAIVDQLGERAVRGPLIVDGEVVD
jgi:hypothetical protein